MISAYFEGLDRVFAGFGQIERRLDNMRLMFELFGREFYREETDWFNAGNFASLSPGYAKRKQEIFGNKPILRATDLLFKSLTQQGSEGNVHRITDQSAEFGTSDRKAMFHQFGTSRMPARPPLAQMNTDRYLSIAGQYLAESVRLAGFN